MAIAPPTVPPRRAGSPSPADPQPLRARRPALAALAALLSAGALAACGGSETTVGLGGTTDFTVASCALGCNQPGPTGKLKCEAAQIKINQEIWAEFTQPVDPSSVNKSTFKVTNTLTGKTPTGTYVVDNNNPRRVIFKPSLSFDSNGNPKFGLDEGGNYEIDIPGSATGGGPYIRSTTGELNSIGVQCFVIATGKSDPVPGAPSVRLFVDPLGVEFENLTAPVPLASKFRFEFDDLMNAATLVNPSTGKSVFIEVALDLDGNTQDISDQLEVPGSYTITFDETVKTTTVVFTPVSGFPSSGSLGERRIVVKLPPTITDVADNPLSNAGTFVVTTESVAQVVGSLTEDFVTDELIDEARTGTNLTVVGNIGLVSASNGGGSGRLGDLLVSSGESVTLVTDGTTIGGLDAPKFGPPQPVPPELIDADQPDEFFSYLIDNYDPAVDTPGSQVIVVTDGVFEFSSVVVRGTLRFVGANPPRLFARGSFDLDGAIDVAGLAAPGQSSEQPFGGLGGAGGPSAGSGGQGADRADTTGTEIATKLGIPHNTTPQPGPGAVVDGREGQGRGGQTPGVDDFGAGKGGVHWPTVYPGPLAINFGGLLFDSFCESDQVGAPGSGGSYGTIGKPSLWVPSTILGTPPPPPPVTQPGASVLPAGTLVLDPDAPGGLLQGGAGGGGGGGGVDETKTNGQPLNCGFSFQPPLQIATYYDHSSGGGGGGGGAVQLQAGGAMFLNGQVRASGGAGGSDKAVSIQSIFSAPGGGGSGGAVLLQARQLSIINVPGIVDVSGGKGGDNSLTTSKGGAGGAGVAHFEVSGLPPLDFNAEAAKVGPIATDPTLTKTDVLRTGTWTPVGSGPSARSGLQSCWLKPEGTIFNVEFDADVDVNSDGILDPGAGDVAAWDLGVYLPALDPGAFQSLRELNPLLSGILGTPASIQSFAGNDLGDPTVAPFAGSPLVVRFQGVRAVAPVNDPCTVSLTDVGTPLLAGSLTPWVQHPAELSTYWDAVLPGNPGLAAKRRPNLIRYQVVLDRNSSTAAVIGGFGDLRIDFIAD